MKKRTLWKSLLFVLVVITTSAVQTKDYVFVPPDGWQKVQGVPDVAGMWKSKKDRSVVVIKIVRSHQKISFNNVTSKELGVSLTKLYRKLLSPLGIKGWRVTRAKFMAAKKSSGLSSGLSSGQWLKVKGDYRGIMGQRVYFEQWQYFRSKTMVQITYSTERVWKPSEAHRVLRRFQVGER